MYIDYDLENAKRRNILKYIAQELRDLNDKKNRQSSMQDDLTYTLYMCKELWKMEFVEYCKKNAKCFSGLFDVNGIPIIKHNHEIVDMGGLKSVTISYTKTDDGKWISELTTTE